MILALGTGSLIGIVVAAIVVIVLIMALHQMVNIVQQGQVGVVKRLGRVPQDPRARAS